MSKTAIEKIVSELWPRLRGFLLQIGRWLIEFIWRRGRQALIHYMEGRIDVFERRLRRVMARRKRVKARRDSKRYEVENWRVRWLRGRIARWRKAILWLETKQAERIKGKVGTTLLGLAEKHIPEEAPDESFSKWVRKAKKKAAA